MITRSPTVQSKLVLSKSTAVLCNPQTTAADPIYERILDMKILRPKRVWFNAIIDLRR